MEELIESTYYVIKKELGRHYEEIKKLDPLPKQRQLTTQIRSKLIKDYGEKCAYCQKEGAVETAHVIPLEIGGITVKENLVLLCKKCHTLYDSGHLSICAMQKLVNEWRNGISAKKSHPPLDVISPPPAAMSPPPEILILLLEEVLKLQNKGWFNKAIKIIDNKLKDYSLDKSSKSYLNRKKAELIRRRSAGGVIPKALKILQDVDQRIIPSKYRPIFFYEFGYVHRLAGHHSEAAQIYKKSAEASKKIGSDLEYIAASVSKILCLLATMDSLSEGEAKKIINQLNKFEKMAEEHGEYWGGRWGLNCAVHRLQVCLKWGDKEESWKALSQLKDRFFRSDLQNGWDVATKQSISLLEGMTLTMFPRNNNDLKSGIDLLARTFVTRLGPRQRPEGIRDAGLALVNSIKKARMDFPEETIEFLENLMKRTMDGTSYLWPWNTESITQHGN
jgi:tetratricopeptide (TPR) repeat protein